MEVFGHVFSGFAASLQPVNLLYCFAGVLLGTLVGVLPGIGPSGTISILLPLTFGISPVTSVIFLAGIYYGAMYGGSTTSILVNIPGETASVVTCLDGYQMARNGRAGAALGMSAFGSFLSGTGSIILLMFLSYPLAKFALRFGPPEYFCLIILGITFLTFLAQGSMAKALLVAGFGFLLSFVGMDEMTGQARYTFGVAGLLDGVGVLPLVMGLFGVAEVFKSLHEPEQRVLVKTDVRDLLPTRQDWKDSAKPIARGSLIGFLIGIIPGGSAPLASFASYALEKRCSPHPERFGNGTIEGVAGPESANNSAFTGGLVTLFSLGIPPTVVSALLFAALMIQGIQPGPLFIPEHPDVFWGLVASMYIGNVMLLFINIPLIGLWVKMLRIPARVMLPLVLLFCVIGTYSVRNSVLDVTVMMFFGVIGYLMEKFRYEPAPLVLAFVLGPLLEKGLRQSLKLSRGDFTIFFTRPLSVTLLLLAAALIASHFVFAKAKQKIVLAEECP
ncbi:MAG: tripartite tricarboxylate transporter permease [Deltaproteobacteria bacterium]|nr:tripartite tricarboxylate transporter permease [Deltaproteobacteria bacterium]